MIPACVPLSCVLYSYFEMNFNITEAIHILLYSQKFTQNQIDLN